MGQNYTGMLLSVSKTPGKGVVDMMAMEAAPGKHTERFPGNTLAVLTFMCLGLAADPVLLTGKGGKAGIWQSGMGIAAHTDNNRVFFVTGQLFWCYSFMLVNVLHITGMVTDQVRTTVPMDPQLLERSQSAPWNKPL